MLCCTVCLVVRLQWPEWSVPSRCWEDFVLVVVVVVAVVSSPTLLLW